jgi:hypothetical protein
MITGSLAEGHGAFEIVHVNVLAPTPRPVTPEVGDVGVVMLPEPPVSVHTPVPVTGVFPASVAVVAQTVWSGPALGAVGGAVLIIVIASVDGVQAPLLIVHTNVLVPTLRPVTPEVGEPGEVTVADPAVTVHAPVPTVAVLPASVAVVAQTVWSGPAFAVVGAGVTVIVWDCVAEQVPEPTV